MGRLLEGRGFAAPKGERYNLTGLSGINSTLSVTPKSVEKRPKGHAVGVLLASLDDPWRVQMKADIEAAAAKHPELRLSVMDADSDAAKQQAQLDEVADRHVEVVIVSPRTSRPWPIR